MSHAGHSLVEVPATLGLALAALVYARGWFRIRRSFPSAIFRSHVLFSSSTKALAPHSQ